MNGTQSPADAGGVLAVLVLYGRGLSDAVSWPVLLDWMADGPASRLRHCLIYDNSPRAMVDPGGLPQGAHLVWDPANHGTAGAYASAAALAMRHGCDWLLLLDQDTGLPPDYLDRVGQARSVNPDAAVLVPRIRQGADLVSPATITPAGSISPCADPAHGNGVATAISSGAVVRREVMAEIAFPTAIWLDYVDHWMFLELAKRNMSIGTIDAELVHDLSVRTPATLSDTRVRSILAAESAFYAVLGCRARAVLPLRRLLRALRYVAAGRPALAGLVLGSLTGSMRRP